MHLSELSDIGSRQEQTLLGQPGLIQVGLICTQTDIFL